MRCRDLWCGHAGIQHQVNAAAAVAGFIVHMRKNRGLDQREAVEIFDGVVDAFPRHESGKTRSPLSLVKLLRVLDQYPE